MRLENFLFCFELELGGTIIGFYHLTVYCLLAVTAIVTFILALIYSEDINLMLLALVVVVSVIVLCFLVYISWQLITGVLYRDPDKVQKFRILSIFGLFVNVLIVLTAVTQINQYTKFNFNAYHITILIVYLIISFMTQVYIFIVVDSLYKRFRDEEFTRNSTPRRNYGI